MKKRKFTKQESLLISFLDYCNKNFPDLKLEFMISKTYMFSDFQTIPCIKYIVFKSINDFKRFLRKTRKFQYYKKESFVRKNYIVSYRINAFKFYVGNKGHYSINFVDYFENVNRLKREICDFIEDYKRIKKLLSNNLEKC